MADATVSFYTVRGMFDTFVKSIGGLRTVINDPIAVIVELLLIGISVNWCFGVLHGTRGTRPLRGVLTVLVGATLIVNVMATHFDWPRLALLYRYFMFGLAFVALVAFQPELRRAVIRAGDVRFLRRGTPQSRVIKALVQSARYLSRNRYGGLIAIQRAVDLSGWAEKGTLLNADVSANMLNTIFFPNSPLHDLGVIIAGRRILAANCQFPLAESDEVESAVGSRHLAAVGMSYETDALVLVVSEETGTISIADGGKLNRFLSLDDLADELSARLSGFPAPVAAVSDGKRRLPPLSHAWRFIRRFLVVAPLTLVIWMLANQASQADVSGVDVRLVMRLRDPNRVVDVEEPQPAVFKVSFRGTSRAIEALRDETTTRPLRVDWLLPENYPIGQDRRAAVEVLDSLNEIQGRGLAVLAVQPEEFVFIVDELVTRSMPVAAETGDARVVEKRFEPDRVQVTFRKRHLLQLPESQYVVTLPLDERLRGVPTDQTLTFQSVPVPDRVGGFPLVSAEPRTVDVSFRIVGQQIRRTFSAVPVRIHASWELLQSYIPEPVDPQELLVSVQVEGERADVAALAPNDIRAFVTVTSDLLSPAEVFRVPVEYYVPAGVSVVSQRTVQIRLRRLEQRGS